MPPGITYARLAETFVEGYLEHSEGYKRFSTAAVLDLANLLGGIGSPENGRSGAISKFVSTKGALFLAPEEGWNELSSEGERRRVEREVPGLVVVTGVPLWRKDLYHAYCGGRKGISDRDWAALSLAAGLSETDGFRSRGSPYLGIATEDKLVLDDKTPHGKILRERGVYVFENYSELPKRATKPGFVSWANGR